jgi:hypothetical protein
MADREDVQPSAFISYTHDSDAHKKRVAELATRLRAEGIDCDLDEWVVSPPEGWPKWMLKHVMSDKFVLVVCTELYFRRVTGLDESGGLVLLCHIRWVVGEWLASSMEACSEEIKQILIRAVTTWEVMHEHHLYVGSCEDRLVDLEAFPCDEEHGHHDQCCMVVPTSPPANLVLAESTLLLGILQGALDEVALSLHVSQPFDRGLRGGVRQGVLEPVRLPRHD